eukprot:s3048_g25.t1
MVRVANAIDSWKADHQEYQVSLAELDIEVPSILWANDIAIPVASKHANDLAPFLQALLNHAHAVRSAYGFLLNFAKGKTSAVLTFQRDWVQRVRVKLAVERLLYAQRLFRTGPAFRIISFTKSTHVTPTPRCTACELIWGGWNRLQQHLAYIPRCLGYNACFQALQAQGRCVSYERVDLGQHAAHCCYFLLVPHAPTDAEKSQLADAWVEVLCSHDTDSGALDPWLEMIFLTWGEHWLPDVISTLDDGVAE